MTLRLNGDGSGFTEIKAADTAGDNSIKLPASNGSAYQLLRNGSSAGELAYESDLRVDGTGNVGVGIDPAYSGIFGGSQRVLHVGGTAAPGVRITSSTSDQGDFIIQAGNSGRATYVASLAENGDIAFFTRPLGGSVTERFRLKGSGQIALSADCPGIDFSGIQTSTTNGTTTSELLDSYEEGTWVPSIASSSTNPTVTYAGAVGDYNRIGRYVKVGAIVTCFFDVTATSITGGSGTPWVTGLPFAVPSNHAGYSAIQWRSSNAFAVGPAETILRGYAEQGANYLVVQLDSIGTNGYGHNGTPSWGSSGRITGYITYQTNV